MTLHTNFVRFEKYSLKTPQTTRVTHLERLFHSIFLIVKIFFSLRAFEAHAGCHERGKRDLQAVFRQQQAGAPAAAFVDATSDGGCHQECQEKNGGPPYDPT